MLAVRSTLSNQFSFFQVRLTDKRLPWSPQLHGACVHLPLGSLPPLVFRERGSGFLGSVKWQLPGEAAPMTMLIIAGLPFVSSYVNIND